MKSITPLALVLCLLPAVTARAQHCPPIVESYLGEMSIRPDAREQSLTLKLEYAKFGGRPMPKYQVYIIGYLEKNQSHVPASLPNDVLDNQFAQVLHTQAVERNKDGRYALEIKFKMNDLAKKIIEGGRLGESDRESPGGWGSYKDRFRMAVFIPFLEDKKYAVIAGLPEDRHECNYGNERALLFEPLPWQFSIHFGTVQGARLAEGEYCIQVNGAKPSKQRQ